MVAWVGVDPGARWTGVVARHGQQLLHWAVVDLHEVSPGTNAPTREYFDAVELVIRAALAECPDGTRVAIEGANKPTPQLGVLAPRDLLHLGISFGVLWGRFPQAVVVDPNRHGRRPLVTYPQELVTPGEARNATRARTWNAEAPDNTTRRHARSAWDIAGAATATERVRLAVYSERVNRQARRHNRVPPHARKGTP